MFETDTRVFFVVDSYEANEEIFETLEKAEEYLADLKKRTEFEDGHSEHPPAAGARLYVALVRNAYREKNPAPETGTHWNYEDFSDTFEIVKVLVEPEVANAPVV